MSEDIIAQNAPAVYRRIRMSPAKLRAVKFFRRKGVDKRPAPAYNSHNNQTAQTCDGEKYPARQTLQRAPDGGNGAASGRRMDSGGRTERQMGQVGTDGYPTRYPSGRV